LPTMKCSRDCPNCSERCYAPTERREGCEAADRTSMRLELAALGENGATAPSPSRPLSALVCPEGASSSYTSRRFRELKVTSPRAAISPWVRTHDRLVDRPKVLLKNFDWSALSFGVVEHR